MSDLMKPCITCGEPTSSSYCEEHNPKPSRTARGYDAAWARLSRRARKLSPHCEHCGATHDLTTDHSPEAWKRKSAGLQIRLQDVRVLCRSCNSKAGAAR